MRRRAPTIESAFFRRSSEHLHGPQTYPPFPAALDLLSRSRRPPLKRARYPRHAPRDYSVKPVPLTQVDILDDFWAPRMEVNRNVSIWHCFKKMEEFEDFGSPKLIEGAAYMLAKRSDPKLEGYVDQVIDKLVTQLSPRLTDPDKAVRVSGHFLEAAVAYYAVTGKRKMLDAALEDAKVIDANFGPGKRDYISEHEGQKIGLLELYRQTGHEKYLEACQIFHGYTRQRRISANWGICDRPHLRAGP